MQSKLIHDADGAQTYAVILEIGDEVMSCLETFAAQKGLNAASFKAIGAFEKATLAFFDWQEKSYLKINVGEQVEVASLTGDIAMGPDGNPAVHAHAVLGTSDGRAIAGHVTSGLVRPTLEIILTEAPTYLRKRFHPEVGLALIDTAL
jgi:predicted DNA-binding protein with PD1-like motif